MVFAFFVLGFALGAFFGYTAVRAVYHYGCSRFMLRCALLIETGEFNEKTVRESFRSEMPWQPKNH